MMKVRTFVIADDDPLAGEGAVSDFLAQVQADRIDTAYAPGGWRVLIVYTDPRRAEEAEQIASVIAANLRAWRDQLAAASRRDPQEVLPEDLLTKIAQYVPTTTLELRVVLSAHEAGEALRRHDEEIVHIVRQTLDELS